MDGTLLILLVLWVLCGIWGYKIMEGKGRTGAVGAILGVLFGLIGVAICALFSKTMEKRIQEADEFAALSRRMRGE